MNKIQMLQADLKRQTEQYFGMGEENFKQPELTDEDRKTLAKMAAEQHTLVITEDVAGNKTESTVEQFMETFENNVVNIEAENQSGETELVKIIDSLDVKRENEEKLLSQTKDAIKSKLLESRLMTGIPDNYNELETKLIESLVSYMISLGYSKAAITADSVHKELHKKSLAELRQIIPQDVFEEFCPSVEIAKNVFTAKEKLLATIGYIVVTNLDLDLMNDYITHENHKIQILNELANYNVEFSKVINSDETLTEMIKKAHSERTPEAAKLANVFKRPDDAYMLMKTGADVSLKLAEAYTNLLPKYEGDEIATDLIQKEISVNTKKAEIYQIAWECNAIQEKADTYLNATLKTTKKLTNKFLDAQMKNAIKRIQKSQLNIPVLGYTGKELNDGEITLHFIKAANAAIVGYNGAIKYMDENQISHNLKPIETSKYFGECLLLVYSRLVKAYTSHDATEEDAMLIDCISRMLCLMPSDLALTYKIYEILKPMMDYLSERL